MPRDHLPRHFGMHRVRIIQQRRTKKRKAPIKQDPQSRNGRRILRERRANLLRITRLQKLNSTESAAAAALTWRYRKYRVSGSRAMAPDTASRKRAGNISGKRLAGPRHVPDLQRLVSGHCAATASAANSWPPPCCWASRWCLAPQSGRHLFAMRDSCPHRGIPLSCGWFDGETVTCKYHGWVFEPGSGQCTRDSFAHQPRRLDPAQHLRHRVSLRGTRWLRLGLPPRAGTRPVRHPRTLPLPPVPEVPSSASGIARASHRRPALQRGPRHHRADGSCPRTIRAPGLVVALARQHPRESKSTSSRSRRAFACPRMRRPPTARLTNCWASTASRSRPPSISCCPTGATRRSAAGRSGSPA